MVVYQHTSEIQKKEYNTRLLRRLCDRNGVPMTDDPAKADCIWVSLCDIVELPLLLDARKFGKPIIMGGGIAHLPLFRYLADYVCVGEAYHFVKAFADMPTLPGLESIPEVATKDKEATPDEWIDYQINPIIQVTRQAYYYYSGKGCPQRCKFCLMSYTRQWQKAPEAYVLNALKAIPDKGRLYLMTSHMTYDVPDSIRPRLGIQDVKIREFLHGWEGGKRIRAAIEFASDDIRRDLAKPLSIDDIRAFIADTGDKGVEVTIYFVAGLEGTDEIVEFLGSWPEDGRLSPRLILVWTYLDPQIPTPMADFDIRQKREIDTERIFREAQTHNRRIRVHQAKYMAHSTWRTIMQRASNPEEIAFAWSQRNEKDNDLLLKKAEMGYPHLLGTATLADVRARPRFAQ